VARTELASPARLEAGSWTGIRAALLAGSISLLICSWILPPAYCVVGFLALAGVWLTVRWPVAGFGLLAFSVPWGSGLAIQMGGFPVTSTDVLVAALAAAWLGHASVERRNPLTTRIWLPYVLIFLAGIAISATQASDTHASLREIIKWIEMAFVYLSAVALIRNRGDFGLVIAAIVAAASSQALFGYVQFAFQLGPEAFLHGQFLRAYGSFDQPNPYAGYLNMVLPLALAMGVRAPRAAQRSLYRLAFLVILGAIVVSESRGALLASALALTVVLGCLSSGLRRVAWIGALALCGGAWGAALGVVPLGPFQRLLNAAGLGGVSFGTVNTTNFSAVERAAHWLAGVRMFAAHPLLGVGIGNYADAYPAYHPRGWYAALAHAHNYYINIAAEAGIVGLVSYLLFLGSALWYSYAAMRRVQDGVHNAALVGLVGALVATSFHNLFDVLYVHGTVALLGLMMAFVPLSLGDTTGRSASSLSA